MSDPLALPLQLELDRRALREHLWLRAVASVIAILASAWLLAAQDHWSVALGGTLAGAFAVVWLARGLRDHARALQGEHHVLVDNDGITHQQGARTTRVGWDNVVAVAVDEDRLVVKVECRDCPSLIIEPSFGGLGVYDLQAVIAGAWKAARNG